MGRCAKRTILELLDLVTDLLPFLLDDPDETTVQGAGRKRGKRPNDGAMVMRMRARLGDGANSVVETDRRKEEEKVTVK